MVSLERYSYCVSAYCLLILCLYFFGKIIENRLATFNAENEMDGIEKKSSRRLVFLDSLLAQMNSEKLSLDDIQEEVDTFMFEVITFFVFYVEYVLKHEYKQGHDTTAAAINFTCYLVASHPDIQAKIHAEIDSIFYGKIFFSILANSS